MKQSEKGDLKAGHERIWHNSAFMVSHGSNLVKSSPVNAGDLRDTGSIPRSGRSLGGGPGNPCQYSRLGNPRVRGIWQATVHRVEKNWA